MNSSWRTVVRSIITKNKLARTTSRMPRLRIGSHILHLQLVQQQVQLSHKGRLILTLARSTGLEEWDLTSSLEVNLMKFVTQLCWLMAVTVWQPTMAPPWTEEKASLNLMQVTILAATQVSRRNDSEWLARPTLTKPRPKEKEVLWTRASIWPTKPTQAWTCVGTPILLEKMACSLMYLGHITQRKGSPLNKTLTLETKVSTLIYQLSPCVTQPLLMWAKLTKILKIDLKAPEILECQME